MTQSSPLSDVAGVGLNATDTIIRVPHFPVFNTKVEFHDSKVMTGGQVATAMVACSRWGLKTRYVGKIGDDAYGQMQKDEMEAAGVEAHWVIAPNCQSQSSFILVDGKTGERTVLWKRDPRLELLPAEINKEWVVRSRLLHVDGHDCAGAAAAARWARESRIPVTADLDNLYPGVEGLLENVDFMISSREFPGRLCGELDLLRSLPQIASRFGNRVAAATMGEEGAIAWDGIKFHYCPAYQLNPLDTTGAGDIFHAAFVYTLLKLSGQTLQAQLEFSCAAAALACMAPGARGGIASLAEIEHWMRTHEKRPGEFSCKQLEAAAASARTAK